MTTIEVNPASPERHFGALPKPFDPAELKYSMAFRAPPKADWNQPVGVPKNKRPHIWNQGSTSSCTASICEAVEAGALLQGRTVPDLSHEHVYWEGRAKQNFFNQGIGADTGAYISDICDVALLGIGKEALHPFDGSVWDQPSAAVVADRANQLWVARHRPIYPGPGAMAHVWDALSQGWPIVMGWILDGSMYDPHNPYPRGLNPRAFGAHGYHQSILLRMRRYDDGRLYIGGPNSWGPSFFKEAGSWWPEEARPGEWWADAEDWLERTTSPVNELRALEMVPYSPPQPEPQPEPEDEMAFSEGYAKCREDVVAFEQDSIDFYQGYEPKSEFIRGALTYATWAQEQFKNFLPPMAAPKYSRPTANTTGVYQPKVVAYDPSSGRPIG